MSLPSLHRRLTSLEATRSSPLAMLTDEERERASAAYEAGLDGPPDPAHEAYLATQTLDQVAADYEAMLRGGPVPWLS